MVSQNKITLLEDIMVDYNLPKYIKEKEITETENEVNNGIFREGTRISAPASAWGAFNFSDPDTEKKRVLQSLEFESNFKGSLKSKLRVWFYKNFIMGRSKPLDITFVDLEAFFESIKTSVKNIDKKSIDEILEKYIVTLDNAQDNHQTALVERIMGFVEILRTELILSESKFNKYLTEQDVVKFYNLASVHGKYKTNLCLTYIKNFVKIIPEDVTALKKEADALKIFDNYVVLHYDYSGDAVAETKEEEEKRKDPVLFGVIKGSKNLYYIGDWVDDYCDLTLDVIIKKLGKKNPHKLNAKTSVKESGENINKI